MMKVDDVVNILAIDLLGVVPDDESIIRAGSQGEPAVFEAKCPAGRAYRNVARRIQGEVVPLLPLEKRGGFFFKLKSWLGIR